jgi:hypothetical protein
VTRPYWMRDTTMATTNWYLFLIYCCLLAVITILLWALLFGWGWLA